MLVLRLSQALPALLTVHCSRCGPTRQAARNGALRVLVTAQRARLLPGSS